MTTFKSSTMTSAPILPPRIAEHDVLTKCDYFVDVQLWPLHKTLNARGWLGNFNENEKEHAVHLLNGFLYFAVHLVDQMFAAAVQSISSRFHTANDPFLTFQSKWQQFMDTAIITHVTGEIPNPSDSGLTFARKARQLLGVPESRIKSPEDAVRQLMQQSGPVLFVDDFVGSGEQFLKTWRRGVPAGAGTMASFERVSAASGSSFYYCPVLCTEYGYERIHAECPLVSLQPAHILTSRYSALTANSYIWPSHLQSSAVDFLRTASTRVGIPEDHGVNDWRGFHELGLAVALGDSIPDATMPIFHWEKNGWTPLFRRT